MRIVNCVKQAVILSAVVALGVGVAAGDAPPNYIAIDVHPAGYSRSRAYGISGGQLVGSGWLEDDDKWHTLLWPGVSQPVVDLHPTGFESSEGMAIAPTFQVGSGYTDPEVYGDRVRRALLWSGSAGTAADLTPPGFGASVANGAWSGQQIGSGESTSDDQWHALMWSGSNLTAVDLHPAGYEGSHGKGISETEQVGGAKPIGGGYHAVLWHGTPESCVDLHPAGYDESYAYGCVEGQHVGSGDPSAGGGPHALLWSGTAASVVDLHPVGFNSSYAHATNGAYQAGRGHVETTGREHALAWCGTAESAVDLHLLLPNSIFDPEGGSQARGMDVAGNIVGSASSLEGKGHAVMWWLAGEVDFASLAIGPSGPIGDEITLDAAKVLNVTAHLEIEGNAVLAFEGGIADANTCWIRPGGMLSGYGTLNGPVHGGDLSVISASGSGLTLGDANSYSGFVTEGTLVVADSQVVLLTKGFAGLGNETRLNGGSLVAADGVAIATGDDIVGKGTVDGKVAAGFGSTIEATGPLSLGDTNAYDGFFSDGSLLTGPNTVTLYDRNEAVLGSLTELGDGASGGTLTAGAADPSDTHAHFFLEQGKNMVGRGEVNGNYKNHGHVIGDGTAMDERIVFNSPWIVTGKGTFENTLILGTFAPGESPAITSGTNQGFGGTVEVELGGMTPGFGDDNHDQIVDDGTILLVGEPTLEILPWNDFVPAVGDEFVVMTWAVGLDGAFGDVVTDPWFTDRDIAFDLHYENVSGAGNLTLEAVPEPATLALLAAGGLGMLLRRRRS